MTSVQGDAAGAEAHEGLVVGGRYRLVRRLGAGGFGRVWQAADEALGVDVAVKEVWLAPAMSPAERGERLLRAQREARSAARLRDHPNVVAVHDVLVENGAPWIVMQLVQGRSLADLLREGESLPPEQVTRIARAMLAALGAAHAAGVVHRDVKPANIMLTDDGRVLLTDFGIAVQAEDTALTATGALIGSVEYMAPERIQGQDNGAAGDLFSLGVALYHAVEGLSPFRRATPTAALLAVICDPAPPLRHAAELAPLIEGLVVKDPAQRLTVAGATALLDSAEQGAAPVTPAAPTPVPAMPLAPPAVRAVAPSVAPPAASPVASPVAPFVAEPTSPIKRRTSRGAIAAVAGAGVLVCGVVTVLVVWGLTGSVPGGSALGLGGSSLKSKLLQAGDMPAGFQSDWGAGDMGYLRPADGSWPATCAARNQEPVWHRTPDNTVEYTAVAGDASPSAAAGGSYGESVQQVSADQADAYLQAAKEVAACPSYTVDLVDSGGSKQRCTVTTTTLPAPTVAGATGDVVARRETYSCADVADATPYAPVVIEKLTTSRGGYLVEFFVQPGENGSDNTLDPQPLLDKALAKLS
ncbi:protein kinase [Kitasatospora sp. NPDC008050]|uniref:serine/threonine-protein kinase n=1 Tax=Kitasatospora sp. NPDC008050 TaxID=3364021 RepID=UPI0036EB04A4